MIPASASLSKGHCRIWLSEGAACARASAFRWEATSCWNFILPSTMIPS